MKAQLKTGERKKVSDSRDCKERKRNEFYHAVLVSFMVHVLQHGSKFFFLIIDITRGRKFCISIKTK